ncbi:glutaminase A [Mycolicibacterium sp.]|uniref:glutaminase A n=1 Tax=Mycolicibacterium sp. TaxID=2320850 RepID=UPI001DFB49BE|nr:glutaminase A [Mycolicibacterium sp.]MCB1291776.1 glutaminase A [Mycobacterium sp.]MCB9409135.1 glutaminase A [Mycolicibacterium sp.]
MAELVQRYLDGLVAEFSSVDDGALADYIPELTQVDPGGFGLAVSSADGYVYESGDARTEFTIQSISKPFTYALALDAVGQEAVDAKIGVEPSGDAFNEISVDERTKAPKNPMINAGAIAAVSLVPGATPDERFARIAQFYSACAGRPLELDEDVYHSEKATGSRNRAIAYMLTSFGVLENPDDVLDVYFRQCSLRVTSVDLARMAATLARGGINPQTGRRVTAAKVVQRTLSVMVTCGMYNGAGDWVSAVGMPAKSGVGGGITAVLPGQLGIGVYSPLLDARGNSVRGVLACRALSERLGLHFLTVGRESRATIRATYSPRDRVRVYEMHGDLMFAGVEKVLRTVDRDSDEFSVAVLDVTRADTINDAARHLLAGMNSILQAAGKKGFVVDPDSVVIRPDRGYDDVVFGNLDDAMAAADAWLRSAPTG